LQVRAAPGCLCQFSSKPIIDKENQPVKFSTSDAADKGRLVNKVETSKPRHERLIIIASIATFIIYFLYLREENDLDGELKVSLYDRLPGIIFLFASVNILKCLYAH
jgi:CCSMST1 family